VWVWPSGVVDQGRAHAICLATVARFAAELANGGNIADLRTKLLEADPRHVWDAVFGISSARGGSFRMLYCDVAKNITCIRHARRLIHHQYRRLRLRLRLRLHR
jgi:hypothetical protein